MTKNKRKAIVFDLDVSKNTKFARPSAGRTANIQYTSEGGAGEEPESTWVPLMQPETLTLPFMLEALDERKVKLSSEARNTKREVEKLFLEHITSKPQRSHRSNRFGCALSRLQRLCTTYHAPAWHQLVKDSKMLIASSPSTSQQPPSIPAPALDRLKPPVQSCINTARKTIKLGGDKKDTVSLPTNASSPDKSIDKIDALLKPTVKSSSNSESINISGCSKRVLSINKSPNIAKKLKTVDAVSVATSSEVKSPSTPKKKHASVSWP